MRIYFNEAIGIKALYVDARNKLEVKHVVRVCSLSYSCIYIYIYYSHRNGVSKDTARRFN